VRRAVWRFVRVASSLALLGGRPPHRDPFVRAPGPILSGGGLIHPPNTSMDVLAAWGGIRLYRDLPFPGLINEPVADLELHRQNTACGWRLRLLRGPSRRAFRSVRRTASQALCATSISGR